VKHVPSVAVCGNDEELHVASEYSVTFTPGGHVPPVGAPQLQDPQVGCATMLVPPAVPCVGMGHPGSLHGGGDGPVSSAMGPSQPTGTWTQVFPGAHPADATHPFELHMPLGHGMAIPGAHIPFPLHVEGVVNTPFTQVWGMHGVLGG
jgi:hypothetical protein